MRFFLCFVLIALPAFAQEVATVALIRGEVVLMPEEKPLKVGERLKLTETVRTGASSFLRLKFDDGIALQAGPLSELRVTQEQDGATVVDLLKGSLLSHVKPGKSGERYRVKVPMAIFGVRGTTFFTRVDRSGKGLPTFLCLCQGKLAVEFQSKTRELQGHNHSASAFLGSSWQEVKLGERVPHADKDIAALQTLLNQ